MSFDVDSCIRQHHRQNCPRGALMQAVRRGGVRAAERRFEKRDTDPLGPADRLQRGRNPGPFLQHLGEQGQSDRNHVAFLGQAGNRLLHEFVLLGSRLFDVWRQRAERASERH